MAKARTTAFTRGGYSFRPGRDAFTGRACWHVFPAGERSPWSQAATITQASDGATYLVDVTMGSRDARPSFEAACDLVMAHKPICDD